jgi:transposase
MVRERTGQQLNRWLQAVEESNLPELESFADGVQQDKAAVLAGLTLQWSNGPTEGQVTRLKLIKRSMYGRAKLDLLKLRVLHRSPTTPERKKHPKKANQLLRANPATIPREEKHS